jgi:carboxylate-amine ligase
VRVFDVVTEVDDIGLLAALTRGLVDAAATGRLPEGPVWRTDLVRAAHWLASRDGMTHDLVHPKTGEPAPARQVAEDTIAACRALLGEDDHAALVQRFELLLARGTGASRQRAVVERGGTVTDVVTDLRDRFTASYTARP